MELSIYLSKLIKLLETKEEEDYKDYALLLISVECKSKVSLNYIILSSFIKSPYIFMVYLLRCKISIFFYFIN